MSKIIDVWVKARTVRLKHLEKRRGHSPGGVRDYIQSGIGLLS